MQLDPIKSVPIREVFGREDTDFTQWLADHIDELNEAIGIDLEVERTEASVGPYSADILAKDSGTGEYVVIENQFGKTDHDHLGKLITYGAVLDASAVVWIASEFTEEHQRTLDWLNDYSSDVAFYGVKVELLKIGKSNPAIRFNVICRPADIKRQVAVTSLTETQKIQLDFWTRFKEELIKSKVRSSAGTPRPENWFNVPLGRANLFLCNVVYPTEDKIGVRLVLRAIIADAALKQLLKQKDEIEVEIGQKLSWNPSPNLQDKIIAVERDAELGNRESWPEYISWMVDITRKFRKAFMPRVKKLVFPDRNKEKAEEN